MVVKKEPINAWGFSVRNWLGEWAGVGLGSRFIVCMLLCVLGVMSCMDDKSSFFFLSTIPFCFFAPCSALWFGCFLTIFGGGTKTGMSVVRCGQGGGEMVRGVHRKHKLQYSLLFLVAKFNWSVHTHIWPLVGQWYHIVNTAREFTNQHQVSASLHNDWATQWNKFSKTSFQEVLD